MELKKYPIAAYATKIAIFTIVLLVSNLSEVHAQNKATNKAPAKAPSQELSQAQKLLEEGQIDQVIALLEPYTKSNPKKAKAFFYLGTAYQESGQLAKAEENFAKAIEILSEHGADSPQLRINYGNVLQDQDKTEEAMTQYDKALQLNDTEPQAYFNKARCRLKKDDPVSASMALTELKKARELGINPKQLSYYMAMANYYLKNFQAALDNLAIYKSTLGPNAPQLQGVTNLENSICSHQKTYNDTAINYPPPEKRKYLLDHKLPYVIVSVTESPIKTVKLGSPDKHDPDGGQQDGDDDGLFEMPFNEFYAQVKDEASIYRMK